MRGLWDSGLPGTWRPMVHSSCPHNEIAAILKRSLAPLPVQVFARVDPRCVREFTRLRNLARLYVDGRWSYLQTAQSYKGSMRRRYVEAERSLRVDGPISRKDHYLRPFLKAEKINATQKKVKPRLIYPRSPRYNLVLASRLKPFEHWLWGRLTANVLSTGGVGRVVAKGLNGKRRANLIRRKMSNLDDCVCFEVDGKAFEAHVGKWWLAEEHEVYAAAFPGDRELRELLRVQLNLEGELPCGAKFSREGSRASGDFNTGMGNSLIMLVAVVSSLRRYQVPFDVLVDGDNSLIFLRGQDLDLVMSDFEAHVVGLTGQELTLEAPTRVVEEVRFGQSAPVLTGGGWTMVRDWRRVLSGALCSHKWLREPRFAREWVRGVAACELSLNVGVPVLQAWALELQRVHGGPEGVRAHPHSDAVYRGAWFADRSAAREVSPEARLSFERAFGVTPEDQLKLERGFVGGLEFDFSTYKPVRPPSFDRYNLPPGFTEPFLDSEW